MIMSRAVFIISEKMICMYRQEKRKRIGQKKTGSSCTICKGIWCGNRNDTWGKCSGTDRGICTFIKCHKIVIGQSSAKRNHFFSKQTLTEKLIEAVPDIDIHIIPDAMNLDNYRKPHGAVYVGKPTMKDSLLTLFIFAVCTLIGLFIQKLQFTDTTSLQFIFWVFY